MIKNAILDPTRTYRYVLERRWEQGDNMVNFVLLNPSTADESIDDPTIKKCISFAKNWGYDGLFVTNLFAFRATNPNDLKKTQYPIGENNDSFLKEYAQKSKKVVVAWGNHGTLLNRNKIVLEQIKTIQTPYYLELTKHGQPKHPLYVSLGTVLTRLISV